MTADSLRRFTWLASSLLLLYCLAGTALAEAPPTSGPLRLSLEEALKIAKVTSEEVVIARTGVQRAHGEQTRARADFYPQVTASASYERTLATEFDVVFENAGGGGMGGDAGGFDELPFGRRNTYRYGVTASQNLFAGGRTLAETRMAAAGRRQADLALASTQALVALATVQAYYDAALSDQFVSIAESSLKQAEATLEQTRLAHQVGRQPEFELLRAEVAVANQRPSVVEQRMQRDLAYLRLKQRLGLPAEQQLVLTSALPLPSSSEARAAVAVRTAQRAERLAVEQAEQTVRLREAAVSLAEAGYYPNVTLSTTLGRVNYPETLMPEWDDWRTNWTAGLYVTWSLFEGFRTRGQVISAEADLAESKARLRQTQKLAAYERQEANQQLAAARTVWEASSGSVEQAERAYAIAELRYREGVSTQLELTDARLLLEEARANRARAARDWQVARVRAELLPELPLSTVAGTSAGASAAAWSSSTAAAPAAGASPAVPRQGPPGTAAPIPAR